MTKIKNWAAWLSERFHRQAVRRALESLRSIHRQDLNRVIRQSDEKLRDSAKIMGRLIKLTIRRDRQRPQDFFMQTRLSGELFMARHGMDDRAVKEMLAYQVQHEVMQQFAAIDFARVDYFDEDKGGKMRLPGACSNPFIGAGLESAPFGSQPGDQS
jgi:hypothetical protein